MQVVVVGSGISGLTAAIIAAENGDNVELFTKSDVFNSSSFWAQGGIVYRGEKDTSDLLKKDILAASDGMSKKDALKVFSKEAPLFLEEFLIKKIKVPFQTVNSKLSFAGEAAHSRRRILYSHDNTGEVIVKALFNYIKRKTKIKIYDHSMVVDLINIPHHCTDPLSVYEPIRTVGLYVLDCKKDRQAVRSVFADKIILTTGGIGQIYQYTTNPKEATGDGIAIAARAGARIVNMEFTQFHPTTLAVRGAQGFLVSEALRGEGAVIVDEQGREFLKEKHRLGSLAPRDFVSQAIVEQQIKSGGGNVFLSLKHCKKIDIKKRFPNIYKRCLNYKIDIERQDIPITPAFHFSCGGVLCDMDGRTSLPNLFVAGECACSGIHGANRLASTSLLEGLFLGYKAAKAPSVKMPKLEKKNIKKWKIVRGAPPVDEVTILQEFSALKLLMWNYVGVIRKKENLSRALAEIVRMRNKIEEFYHQSKLTKSLLELRNAVHIAFLVADAAIKNKKSKGCHYLVD